MEGEYSRLEKGIIYTTGALLLDVIVGQALTGKPLHECLGIEIEFPDYLQKTGDLTLAVGWAYTIFKPYHMSQRREEQER